MPNQPNAQTTTGQPNQNPIVQPPSNTTRNQNIPANQPAQQGSQNISQLLENDVKRGERWLIGLGIATLFMNGFLAWVYWGQLKEMRIATDAAKSAADTARQSLEMTRRQIASSEAAVLQANVTIRNIGNGPFVQIDIINSGHIAATHVDGYISVPRHTRLYLSNVMITTHSASPEYSSGFITRTVGLGGGQLDMKVLAVQHFRVSGKLDYWNGIEPIKSAFCYGLTVSPYTSAPDWQDCENQKNFQQTLR